VVLFVPAVLVVSIDRAVLSVLAVLGVSYDGVDGVFVQKVVLAVLRD